MALVRSCGWKDPAATGSCIPISLAWRNVNAYGQAQRLFGIIGIILGTVIPT
jgi:hypothetical protein